MLTKQEEIVLEWVCLDYERAPAIVGEVSSSLGRQATDREVFGVLLAHLGRGLVKAYLYETETRAFKQLTRPADHDPEEVWWYCTEAGKKALF
ncbi:hypothetical protein [Oryzomonas rubra]|uniref:Uncharacterized protein n=1 Tax=Oryzomonas rubra TaxID=2509454 RepID=A0A5A9XN61_9BACT|nr:hypothetical protein [Oryzomonas rubra]KAA0893539.1 hypothetical protein ET418_06950 [Oryzomonas rubra]